MLGAPGMKTCVALFAVFSVVACGGATTSVPSAGSDPGTTNDAGTGPGPLPSSTPAPAPTPPATISPHPTPAPPCTECLTTTVSWGLNGGFTSFSTASSLKSCRSYERTRTTENGPPTSICSATLDGCGAAPIAIGNVEAALANPDVTAAFAGTTKTYGSDSRPCDGAVESITIDGKTIEVGGECTGPGGGGGCTQTPCVPVPSGLRALVTLLEDLDKQEASRTPACTGN